MATIDRMTPEGRRLMAELDKLKELAAYVGFQSGTPAKEREGESIVDSSVDLLDVALWNELGTSTAPSRPFLRQSVDNNKDKINAFFQAQLKTLLAGRATAEDVLKKTVVFMKGLVQETIKEGDFPANAPSTVKKKGSDRPLIDTGHMRQSVETVIDRKGRN